MAKGKDPTERIQQITCTRCRLDGGPQLARHIIGGQTVWHSGPLQDTKQ